jgi:hypothetical protein
MKQTGIEKKFKDDDETDKGELMDKIQKMKVIWILVTTTLAKHT